ncbi:Dps family protein [Jeotgalibacillus salarius]|uniref:DNA starvation/stationary phase protection protein n=1 Tax=Jeotgalibacillus salarius TaxID=546023 RepID=A0A4Y8LCK0_9BACL|nr:Dps family protein [Jeotgalibacillus salarius]TFD98246.1 DNA starvation/stationary phase protection protein [Jeotgalibacillus salarius]
MSANPELVQNVNKQIASWTVLYTKLHNYHWYVKGHQFFTLHEKFEELYNEAGVNIDELAERLLALKGEPVATLKESLELSLVEEARGGETADQMVETLNGDFEILMNDLRSGMSLAQKDDDEMTSDMLLSIHQSLEKHAWMLRSFLGQ